MYRCAIVGVSGGRAKGHAAAYEHIRRGKLVAVSTRDKDNLQAFGETYAIPGRYTDFARMFAREKLDLVHVNTPPPVRLEIMQAANEAGIPALIVEKPIACQGEDYAAIAEFATGAGTKVAVNHQLHFHPRRQYLQKLVRDGGIGEVRFIEASSGMNLAYQGTHALQAIGAFNPEARPVTVFGQLSGAEGLRETPGRHFAPDQSLAAFSFDNGIQAVLRCGENAPRVGDGPINKHKRIAVYGARGFIQWTMESWETTVDGRRESGRHEYGQEDVLGQAGLTEAMFDWLEDETREHPLRLELALRDFNAVLGLYMSALHHTVVSLPVVPEQGLIEQMRRKLSSGGSA